MSFSELKKEKQKTCRLTKERGENKMKCDGCLCKNCAHHNRGCADCDICEDGDMTVWGCNQYAKESEENE